MARARCRGIIGARFFPFALVVWENARIAATVAIALFISSSIATLIAMLLPYALARLGRDPAFGAGPLATVIQDLLSILVNFAVGAALLPQEAAGNTLRVSGRARMPPSSSRVKVTV